MVLARGKVALAVVLAVFSASQALAVTTVGYFPFNDGDYRVFLSSDGKFFFDNTSAETIPTNSWEDRVTDADANFVVDLLWMRDATTTRQIIGGNLHPPLATFSPNVVYPDDLVVGGPMTTSGNIFVSGLTAGTYTYSLTVESVDTTQGPFTHCVQLLEEVTVVPIAGTTYHNVTREWRQSGLGLVALTPDVEVSPDVIALLVYARVGSTTYGGLPAANGDFNDDGVVNDLDAGILLDCYIGGPPAYRYVCDIYPTTGPDGVIDDNDLILYMALWRAAHGL